MSRRNVLPVVGFLAVLLLAGCVQVAVHSTVGADGTIEEYRVEVNTSRSVYGLLEQSAEGDGHDSVGEFMRSGYNESLAANVEYDEEFHGDRVTMTITATEFEPPADSRISITEVDGQLVYEDLTFVNESAELGAGSEMSRSITATMSVDYYVTMPGEITDSNADEVDGNTAEWHESGAEAFSDNRIYAKSEKPTSLPMPGFGYSVALGALVALVVAGVLGRPARDR